MPGPARLALVFAAAVAAAAPAAAQPKPSTASGSVVNSGGKGLPGVSVKIGVAGKSNSVAKAVTDAQGRFQIPTPASSTYDIVIKETGYDPAWVSSLCHDKSQHINKVMYKTGEARPAAAVNEYLQTREWLLFHAATLEAGQQREFLTEETGEREPWKVARLPEATDRPSELTRAFLRERADGVTRVGTKFFGGR